MSAASMSAIARISDRDDLILDLRIHGFEQLRRTKHGMLWGRGTERYMLGDHTSQGATSHRTWLNALADWNRLKSRLYAEHPGFQARILAEYRRQGPPGTPADDTLALATPYDDQGARDYTPAPRLALAPAPALVEALAEPEPPAPDPAPEPTPEPAASDAWQCPRCKGTFRPQGKGRHLSACHATSDVTLASLIENIETASHLLADAASALVVHVGSLAGQLADVARERDAARESLATLESQLAQFSALFNRGKSRD